MRIATLIIGFAFWLGACAGGEIAPLPSPGDGSGDDGDQFSDGKSTSNPDEQGTDGGSVGDDTDSNIGPDADTGTTDEATTDSGSTDTGSESGTTDSGTTDSGTTDSGTTDSGTTDSGSDTGTDDTTDPPGTDPNQHTRYPAGQIHSPITTYVAANIKAITQVSDQSKPAVFMKVGASSTVSSLNLNCFAGSHVDLDQDTELLEDTLNHFMDGDAAGVTPYERKTMAAKSGMSVGWSMTGNPAPLEAEIAAISPQFAVLHYGTNDMGMGSTYLSAIWKYGERMLNLIDSLIDQGIVPIVMGITPRGDSIKADRWVPTYNAVNRALAQARQVPHIDLGEAVKNLDGYGLAGDGIHLNVYKENGSSRACIMTDQALQYGFNVRNLVTLQALDGARKSATDQWDAPDETLPLLGKGDVAEPFIIGSLPFADLQDTQQSTQKLLNFYDGCDAVQNESGPEYMYQLTLDKETRLRALVFDRGTVDVDLHLLDENADEMGCIERDHEVIQRTLAPGTYYFSLDSFVSSDATVNAGEYLFVILECHPDDASCD